MNKKVVLGICVVALVLIGLWVLAQIKRGGGTLGSVIVGNEYYATTTRNAVGTALADSTLLKNGAGSVAQVVVQATAAGTIFLCDATTTNVTLRANATSSLNCPVLLPVSATVGTYTYDASFTSGIMFVTTGTLGTSTITWR